MLQKQTYSSDTRKYINHGVGVVNQSTFVHDWSLCHKEFQSLFTVDSTTKCTQLTNSPIVKEKNYWTHLKMNEVDSISYVRMYGCIRHHQVVLLYSIGSLPKKLTQSQVNSQTISRNNTQLFNLFSAENTILFLESIFHGLTTIASKYFVNSFIMPIIYHLIFRVKSQLYVLYLRWRRRMYLLWKVAAWFQVLCSKYSYLGKLTASLQCFCAEKTHVSIEKKILTWKSRQKINHSSEPPQRRRRCINQKMFC